MPVRAKQSACPRVVVQKSINPDVANLGSDNFLHGVGCNG